ncbi:MAG: 50S ribosomal protein L16 3-hydroxylase [Gammaproteobacteria bacterium]|jgi:50S ribosomal protein L16 3-hydroxylase
MKTNPLGEMPIDTFLSEYWQKKPLLIRHGLPSITSPIAADVLAGLACEEGVESRLVIQNENNHEWELKHGPFNDEIFSDLPESHWTLLVQAVDHWVPEAGHLLNLFDFIPRWRIDDLMISYASNGGGVGPHFDNYDVFLIQTSGKRKWEIGGVYGDSAPLHPNVPLSVLSEFEALETWTLEPGDILYVPPGIGHNGIAEGNDCMTCSVGFRAPSHSEILREYTDYIGENLSEALRYEDSDLLAQNNTGEITDHTLNKIQHIMRKYIEDKDSISNWFGRYITTPKYQQTGDLDLEQTEASYLIEDLKKHLASGGLLIRNESSRFAFEVKENKNILFADSYCFDDLQNSNELIKTLCSEIELSDENFIQSDDNLNLLLKLIQRGAIYLAEL